MNRFPYQLVHNTDTILHEAVEGPVSEDLNRKDFSELLILSMNEYNGIGLSANQVGIPVRAFAMKLRSRDVVCYNPVIKKVGEEETTLLEGCLSYPGKEIAVCRPDSIRVSFEDEDGQKLDYQRTGLEAKVFQHELDHLNGISFTSYEEEA